MRSKGAVQLSNGPFAVLLCAGRNSLIVKKRYRSRTIDQNNGDKATGELLAKNGIAADNGKRTRFLFVLSALQYRQVIFAGDHFGAKAHEVRIGQLAIDQAIAAVAAKPYQGRF